MGLDFCSKNEADKKVEVYDLLGSKLYGSQFSKELTVDVSAYSSGTYFVKVIGDNSTEKVIKIIVE